MTNKCSGVTKKRKEVVSEKGFDKGFDGAINNWVKSINEIRKEFL